jgi:very-short-patch-repair endonuclease
VVSELSDTGLQTSSHFQSGARDYDQKRQRFVESFGIKIVRISNTEVYQNLDGVLEMIEREVLTGRGAHPVDRGVASFLSKTCGW